MSDSYSLISRQSKFAMHGKLVAAFPAETMTIDKSGMLVQLDGTDTILDEQVEFDGLTDQLLVFVNGEVFSVWNWALEGQALYRLFCIRNRYGSARLAHAIGDDAFIIARSDLVALQHEQFQTFNTATFKVAPRTATITADLADIDPLDAPIDGRIFTLPTPTGLRVNNALRNPSYLAGEGIQIDWTLTNAGVDVEGVKMVLSFLAVDRTALGTKETAAGSLRLQNFELLPLLNGVEQSFYLNARFATSCEEGILYSPAIEIFVQKL